MTGQVQYLVKVEVPEDIVDQLISLHLRDVLHLEERHHDVLELLVAHSAGLVLEKLNKGHAGNLIYL